MKAGWKIVKLNDVSELLADGDWIESKDQSDNGIRLIQTGNIGDGIFKDREEKARYISESTFKRLRCTEIFEGDCLVSRLPEPVGRSCILPRIPRSITAVDCSIIRFKRAAILPEYFCYYSQSREYQKSVESKTSGTTRKRISRSHLSEIDIPLPPLAEQKRIVALLDEAFAGIDKLSSNAKKRSSDALHVFEQERDYFFSNSENNYPETTISEVTTRLQYGTSEKSASTGRYVVLRMGNIQDGEIDYEDLKYTSSQEVIDQYCLKPGDVLFNRTNSPQWVGKSAIYRGEMPAVFAGYNIKIHTIADKIDPEFLTFFLNSDRAMSFGRSTFISSVNQANINAEKLRSYRLPLPPLLEQKKIAERLKQIKKMSRDLYTIYDNILTKSNHLKASILRHAFNGAL